MGIVDEDVAKLTVVGIAIGSTPGIAARVFEAVASVGANIEAITSSEVRLSVLIGAEHANTFHHVVETTRGAPCLARAVSWNNTR